MAQSTINDKIDELALLVVMAHGADKDTLTMLRELLSALAQACRGDSALAPLGAGVEKLLSSWGRLSGDEQIAGINTLVSSAQQFLSGGNAAVFDASATPSGWGSDLGQNADAGLIVEFIQKHTSELDELEAKVMAVVQGDTKPSAEESAEIQRGLKSYLHNIKGDAGSVGFAGIEKVTHKLEDLVLKHPPAVVAEQLLAYKEWVISVTKAYAAQAAPAELSDDFITRVISRPAPDAPQLGSLEISAPQRTEHQASEVYFISGDREILVEFLVEAEDHLSVVEGILLDKESGYSKDDINAIFRAVHSVKGGSSYFNLKEITSTSHATENLMDKARNDQVVFNQALKTIVLKYIDLQRTMLKDVKRAMSGDGTLSTSREAQSFLASIQDYLRSIAFMAELAIDPELLSGAATFIPEHPTVGRAHKTHPAAGLPVKEAQTPSAPRSTDPSSSSPAPVSSSAPTASVAGDKAEIKNFVKIDTSRLDHLIEYIGEMVISSSMLIRSCRDLLGANEIVMGNSNQLERISREIQQIGMSMRLIPLKGLFQKMSRVAWDTAKKIQKEVKFEMHGEDTELDRSVIDKLADPLMHMVRNAVDHGIEPPDVRAAAGKARAGLVKLSASHTGGNIYIRIEDDGRGLDPEKLIAKAREKGVITPAQKLSREEAYHLIFAPGFSTAAVVTDVSGRGVGMDVVKKNIEAMRGRVNIESEVGKGSIFTIELPLTLAIMEGIETVVGGERFIVPALSIIEFLKPSRDMLMTTLDHGETLKFRGAFLPIFHVGELCGVPDACTDPMEGTIVVVQSGTRLVALVVDKVLGKLSVVIKSLGALFENARGVSGCAIMPDGSVGLILDIPSLMKIAHDAPRPRSEGAIHDQGQGAERQLIQ